MLGGKNMSKKQYYTVEKIAEDTYMLFEKKGVCMYVLIGEEKAMLIDTGYGNHELTNVVRQITAKPLIVVNTHIHPDHSGGNMYFDKIFVSEKDIPKNGEKIVFEQITDQVKGAIESHKSIKNKIIRKILNVFSCDLSEAKFVPFPKDYVIDLGQRTIKIIDCPGHTAGSVFFLDSMTKIMFAGDALGLWLFTDPTKKLDESINVLREIQKTEGYDWICMSHNRKMKPFEFFSQYILFLEESKNMNGKKIKVPGFETPLCIFVKNKKSYGIMTLLCFENQK